MSFSDRSFVLWLLHARILGCFDGWFCTADVDLLLEKNIVPCLISQADKFKRIDKFDQT